MTTASSVSEKTVEVAGCTVRLLQEGSGESLMVLHHSTGSVGWGALHEQLAKSHTVIAPDLPGYGQSTRPDWAREPRDLAIMMLRVLDKLGHDKVTLVGFGFGGFIAAEMATMDQDRITRLVLVGAAGVKPDNGEIVDQMLIDHTEYVKSGFTNDAAFERQFGAEPSDEVKDIWDYSRIITARLSWSPYMFSRRLPHLLSEVETPTLIVWGEHDRTVPRDAGEKYQRLMPNARLEIVKDAAHYVDMEQPEVLVKLIQQHARA